MRENRVLKNQFFIKNMKRGKPPPSKPNQWYNNEKRLRLFVLWVHRIVEEILIDAMSVIERTENAEQNERWAEESIKDEIIERRCYVSKGFLLVLSGPSGSGKGTVSEALMAENEEVKFSTSVTTRKPRRMEVDGENYFFKTEEEFKRMVEEDELLEYAHVHTNYYGTPKDFVFQEIEKGEIVLLEIDVQGALQIKEKYKEAVFIFLLPPTMEELRQRIVGRGTESEKDIETRFTNAFRELDFVGEYDYFVVNDKVAQAVEDIENIIAAEKLRVKRYKDIKKNMVERKAIR